MIKIALGLLPVFLFLLALVAIDSYKLVKVRAVLAAIAAGCIAALASLPVNNLLLGALGCELATYTRYGAPLVEECLKAIYLIYLLKRRRVGFLVDAAIYGFAIGAGFAFVENVYYLQKLPNAPALVWLVRGLGTAVMHGGSVALFGIVSKRVLERAEKENGLAFLWGLAPAVVLHSLFNHFILPPLVTTAGLLIVWPTILLMVFENSEKATRAWLGIGFDTDVELLEIITLGRISETRIGRYLEGMKSNFPGEVVADMLCLLRIHLELAIRAKGVLMLREKGFPTKPDPEIREKFTELRYLERSLGKAGRLALLPLLHTSSRELWQLHMLNE